MMLISISVMKYIKHTGAICSKFLRKILNFNLKFNYCHLQKQLQYIQTEQQESIVCE